MKITCRGRYLVSVLLLTTAYVAGFIVNALNSTQEVEAASLAGFDPGYIISDYQMGNYSSMSEGEIQAFLTSKNSCGNTSYGYYVALSGNPNYQWHFENGHFICLSEERFGNNDNEIGFQYGESAAHIIWQAAQDYRINPQVIIVLLQKETGLITDPIPNNGDYRKATGYGCPDTAACSSQYYGFKNQVRNAAALFRTVLNGGWTNYPLGNNYIQYNPNAACGGSIVNVRSLATSALYRYTPYQPNAGALAAGYGTASCGAYGNRNFYLYFEDWFGGITSDGWPSMEAVVTTNRVANEENDLGVTYNAHVQRYGWLNAVGGGEMIGTVGYSLQMEAFNMRLEGLSGIKYRSYIDGKGWESSYKTDGANSGTTGQGLKIKAIQVNLENSVSKEYNVYYRVHVSGIGWMDWVKNGEIAGDLEKGGGIEAFQVKITKKVGGDNLEYLTHVSGIGWMDWMKNGDVAGTTGQGKRVEAVKVVLPKELAEKGDINYRAHVANIGWMDWVKNGEIAGTTGQGKRVEAIEINISEVLAKNYDVMYRAHVSGIGWMDWVKNGEIAGTTGQGKQIEAIQVKIVKKNVSVGVKYAAHVANIGWMDWVKNGEIAGTTGRALQVEAIKLELEGGLENYNLSYRAHVANIGWMDWVKNGEIAGTTGQGKRIEAIEIKLSDELGKIYDVYYRAHVANIGWMDWVKNGEIAGTTGRALQVEAINIELRTK